ncbi:MAG: XRE family transcriptional regulator [Methanocorpusculum sp.]|nr:XRE family transcriptional regulator [Methanocorpusculum sp.]MDE2525419.1 XRE family transcriptional regulator [Methanocorpusculum sp.]
MTFAERLREVRLVRGLTQEQLAERVSVEKMSISKYESGKMMPSSSTLIALSSALGVDISYFFREISVQLKTRPAFRMSVKSEKLGKMEQQQIIAQTQDALERQLEILEICQSQGEYAVDTGLRRVVRSYEDIEVLSLDVRAAWKLGLDPIENLMEVAESHGFKIILVDGPGRFEAATFTGEEWGPIISLRRGAPKERQRFSLAHELGHYFIQEESVGYQSWDAEQMANRFAAALLMPRELFVQDVGPKRKSLNTEELCLLREKYGASTHAILVRMVSLGIISRALMRRAMEVDGEKHWSSRPHGEAYSDTEMPRLVRKLVFRAVAEGVISEQKGRELLGADGEVLMSSEEAV